MRVTERSREMLTITTWGPKPCRVGVYGDPRNRPCVFLPHGQVVEGQFTGKGKKFPAFDLTPAKDCLEFFSVPGKGTALRLVHVEARGR